MSICEVGFLSLRGPPFLCLADGEGILEATQGVPLVRILMSIRLDICLFIRLFAGKTVEKEIGVIRILVLECFFFFLVSHSRQSNGDRLGFQCYFLFEKT